MNMNIIDIKDIPLNSDIDYGCPSGDDGLYDDQDSKISCDYCHIPLEEMCYQFSILEIEYRYLCEECFKNGIKLCDVSLNFYNQNELVHLNDHINVHYSEKELIDTYRKIKDKDQFLDMRGIDVYGSICEMIQLDQK